MHLKSIVMENQQQVEVFSMEFHSNQFEAQHYSIFFYQQAKSKHIIMSDKIYK